MAENVFPVTRVGIDTPVAIDKILQCTFQDKRIVLPSSGDEETLAILSAGVAIANTQLRVVDKMYKDLPERHIGEIALHSGYPLSGYNHRTDITENAIRDGWYLIGGLGY